MRPPEDLPEPIVAATSDKRFRIDGLKVTMVDKFSTSKDAEAIAIEALVFVASDPELLPRFLALTGIEASAIREAAREPGFLAGVLQFILAHEPTLMQFSESSGIPPANIGAALRRLPLGDDNHQSSI